MIGYNQVKTLVVGTKKVSKKIDAIADEELQKWIASLTKIDIAVWLEISNNDKVFEKEEDKKYGKIASKIEETLRIEIGTVKWDTDAPLDMFRTFINFACRDKLNEYMGNSYVFIPAANPNKPKNDDEQPLLKKKENQIYTKDAVSTSMDKETMEALFSCTIIREKGAAVRDIIKGVKAE